MQVQTAVASGSVTRLPATQEEGQMKPNRYPTGWNEERVRKLLQPYETQSEDEAVADDRIKNWQQDAGFESSTKFIEFAQQCLSPSR